MFFPFFKSISYYYSLPPFPDSSSLKKIRKYFLNNIVESSTRYIINLNIV